MIEAADVGSQDQIRAIPQNAVLRQRLRVSDIDACTGDHMILKRVRQDFGLNEITASDIGKHSCLLHTSDPLLVEEVICLFCGRQSAGDKVRLGKETVDIFHCARIYHIISRFHLVSADSDNTASEGSHSSAEFCAYISRPDHQSR